MAPNEEKKRGRGAGWRARYRGIKGGIEQSPRQTPWPTLHATALLKEVRINVSRPAYEEGKLPQRDPPCSRERRGVGDGHAAGGPAQSPSLPPAPAWPQGT